MKKERGKYVSRAVYAKLQAENKRLLADLKTIAIGQNWLEVYEKWKAHFLKQKMWDDALREIAKKELPKLRKKFGMKALTIFLLIAIVASSCTRLTCPSNTPGREPRLMHKKFTA